LLSLYSDSQLHERGDFIYDDQVRLKLGGGNMRNLFVLRAELRTWSDEELRKEYARPHRGVLLRA
jgi:hypothetical protein